MAPVIGDQVRELLLSGVAALKGQTGEQDRVAAARPAAAQLLQLLRVLTPAPKCAMVARVGDRLRAFLSPGEQEAILTAVSELSRDEELFGLVKAALGVSL